MPARHRFLDMRKFAGAKIGANRALTDITKIAGLRPVVSPALSLGQF
jgi:hypothetical protein